MARRGFNGEERVYPFDKDVIVEKMKERREAHRSLFEEALDGYFAQLTKELEVVRGQLLSNKIPNLYLLTGKPVPQDHTNDYDAVIEMLETTNTDEVELTEEEFRQYVRDEWDWKGQFTQSIASYTTQG